MGKECQNKLNELAEKFYTCRKVFLAMGDETRQLILLTLLKSDFGGIRVGEIAKKTYLTRPAVSRHLKILKDAEIVSMRREGTKNYYYLDSNEFIWKELFEVVSLVCDEIRQYNGTVNKNLGD